MKRTLSIIVVIALMLSTITAFAATKSIAVSDVNLSLNGKKIASPAFAYNGTTYVPLRVISENMGATVGWDSITKTANVNYYSTTSNTGSDKEAKFVALFLLCQSSSTLLGYSTDIFMLLDNGNTADFKNYITAIDLAITDLDTIKWIPSAHPELKGVYERIIIAGLNVIDISSLILKESPKKLQLDMMS